MKIPHIFAISLGFGIVAVLAAYIPTIDIAAVQGGNALDLAQKAWAASGMLGACFVAAFAASSFILVVACTLLDLRRARQRLQSLIGGNTTNPDWHWAFADTALSTIAPKLLAAPAKGADGSAIPQGALPLPWLRIISSEIWRLYAKRFLATQSASVFLAAADVLFMHDAGRSVPPPFDLATTTQAVMFTATLVTILVCVWMWVDDEIDALAALIASMPAAARAKSAPAFEPVPSNDGRGHRDLRLRRGTNYTIERLAEAVEQSAAETARALEPILTLCLQRMEDGAARHLAGISELLAAGRQLIDDLVNRLAATKALEAPSGSGPALVQALEPALHDILEQQRVMIEQFVSSLRLQAEQFDQLTQAARAATETGLRQLGEEVIGLASSVDTLTQRLLPGMTRLVAADERLLAIIRRQDEAAGRLEERWGDAVAGLQAAQAALEKLVEIGAHDERGRRLLGPGSAFGTKGERSPAHLSSELDALLSDMSDAARGYPASPRSRQGEG